MFLIEIEKELIETLSHRGPNTELYTPYKDSKPTVNAYIAATGRAVIAIDLTGSALKKTPRAVCSYFFGLIDDALGKTWPAASPGPRQLAFALSPSFRWFDRQVGAT